MPLEKNELQTMLGDAFPDAEIRINDLAGDNDHWALEITSEEFIGKNRIQQHKMVYAALKGKMGGELHALQLSTKTPS
jgi:stress-induced morphogen